MASVRGAASVQAVVRVESRLTGEQPVEMARVDRRLELHCGPPAPPADRSERAPSVFQSFPLSAPPVLPPHLELTEEAEGHRMPAAQPR